MKKLMQFCLAGLLLTSLSGSAWAGIIIVGGPFEGTDVGSVDDLLTVTDTLANSGETTETAFVNDYLLSQGLDPADYITKIESNLPIYDTETTNVFAADISTDPASVADYFIVKNASYWALYENLVDLEWAVFDASLLPDAMNIPGNFTISHITLFDGGGGVPEPSTTNALP